MKSSDYLNNLDEKYSRKLDEDPTSSCFVLLAEVLIKKKKTDEALRVLVNGLRHNKHNITGRFLLGKIYYDRWMIDNAKKEFEKVIKLAPDNIAVSKILLQIYSGEQDHKKSLELAKNLSFYHPDDEEIKSILQNCESGISGVEGSETEPEHKPDENSSIYLAEEISNQENEILSETLANLYYCQGHYQESLKILRELEKRHPDKSRISQKIIEIENLLLKKNIA